MIKNMVKRATMHTSRDKRGPSRENIAMDVNLIPQLISEQNWRSLRYMLSTGLNDVVEYVKADSTSDAPEESILHWCCRFHPPLDVLQVFYECDPQAADQADQAGRFAIHTACRFGASCNAIEFLIKMTNVAALKAQDKTGKTPLHLTCEHFMRNYDPLLNRDEGISAEEAFIDIVRMLCLDAPDVVNIEDDEDQTALEIAIESGAPLKVVKRLQKTSEKDWRARRGGPGSHADMQKQFQIQTDSKRFLPENENDVLSLLSEAAALSLSVSKVDDDEKRGDDEKCGDGSSSQKETAKKLLLAIKPRHKKSTRAHAA